MSQELKCDYCTHTCNEDNSVLFNHVTRNKTTTKRLHTVRCLERIEAYMHPNPSTTRRIKEWYGIYVELFHNGVKI